MSRRPAAVGSHRSTALERKHHVGIVLAFGGSGDPWWDRRLFRMENFEAVILEAVIRYTTIESLELGARPGGAMSKDLETLRITARDRSWVAETSSVLECGHSSVPYIKSVWRAGSSRSTRACHCATRPRRPTSDLAREIGRRCRCSSETDRPYMYRYLNVAARDCDVVDLPDGSRAVVPRGEGDAFAQGWIADHSSRASAPHEEHDRDAEHERQQAVHREWARRLDEAMDASTSIAHGRMLREAFVADNPEPLLGGADPPAETARASPGRWWCASLGDGPEPFVAWLADVGAGDGYPRDAVARALSELEGQGWTVRHVSEDRRAVHDADASHAVVIAAWFLLHTD
jgi:hypothetical protein